MLPKAFGIQILHLLENFYASKIICFTENAWRGKGLQNCEKFPMKLEGLCWYIYYFFTKQFLCQTFLLYCSVYLTCVVISAVVFYAAAILIIVTIKYQCIEKSRGEQRILPLLSTTN